MSRYGAVTVPVRGGLLHVGRWSGEPSLAASGTTQVPDPPVLAVHGVTAHHLSWGWLADELPATQSMFQLGDHTVRFWRKASPAQLRFIADRL